MTKTMKPIIGIDIPELMFDTGNDSVDRIILSEDQKYLATLHRTKTNEMDEGNIEIAEARLWKLDGLHPTRLFSVEISNPGTGAGHFDLENHRFVVRGNESIVSWPLESDDSRKASVLSELVSVSSDARYSLQGPYPSEESPRVRVMRISNTENNSHVSTIRESFYSADAVYVFSEGSDYLVRYGRDVPVTVWQVSDGYELLNLDVAVDSDGDSVTISPDGGLLAFSDGRLYDLTVHRWGSFNDQNEILESIGFSSDGRYLAGLEKRPGKKNQTLVQIWAIHPQQSEDVSELMQTIETKNITSFAFSPNCRSMFIGAASGKITKWAINDTSSE